MANRARLAMALLMLGSAVVVAHASGVPRWQPGAWWFIASGVMGLAVGDTALFAAYDRLGARLPAMLSYCLAAPLAGAIEWAWLGTGIAPRDAACAGVMLVGVAISLAGGGSRRSTGDSQPARFRSGIAFAVLSAVGVAVSAVMIRRGHLAWHVDSIQAAALDLTFLRCCGGAAAALALWPVLPAQDDSAGYWIRRFEQRLGTRSWRRGGPWLVVAALGGPVAGVMCYQIALIDTPSALMQALVALVPVVVIPLAWVSEGDRPSLLSLLGAAIAVGGVAGMFAIRA